MEKMVIGCGYLGCRVAKLWRGQGHRVWATTRDGQTAAEFKSLGLEAVICDVLQPESLLKLPQVDTVLHCIGLDRSSGASMREVYVAGLANLLDRLPPPRKFLYVSSTSVYGQTDGSWVDEFSPTNPEEESGRIVLEAERVLRERFPEALILRFAAIYGPGRLLRRQAIEKGEPIVGNPDRWLNLIHVDDGVGAILAAEERSKTGAVLNISDGHPVTRMDFFACLAQVLNAPPPQFLPPESTKPKPAHEQAQRRIANHRLRDELGFNPRHSSFREGLKNICH